MTAPAGRDKEPRMPNDPASPFAALATSFQLLTSGPAPLALDGRRLGHGLPARPIPLDELAALLQHPSVPAASQRHILDALVRRAATLRGRWLVGLAGVLLPGLRRTAALAAPLADQLAVAVEADLLARFQDTLGRPHPHPDGIRLATGLLETARGSGTTTAHPAGAIPRHRRRA